MLQRLYVHNFRCLENFELKLGDQSTLLLLGKNGSGKSTVACVLQLLQQIGRDINRVRELINVEDMANGHTDIPVRIALQVKLDAVLFEYELAMDLPAGFRELRVLEEKLSIDGKPSFSRNLATVVLQGGNPNGEVKFGVDWHVIALPIIQAQSNNDPIQKFKDWLARMMILAPIPELMSGESKIDTILPNKDCRNFGEWFSGVLKQYPAAYSTLDLYLKKVMPDFGEILNPTIGVDVKSMQVRFIANNSKIVLPFERLSSGEKCFFLCAVVLAANKHYGPLLCFWDEPDNFLSISEVGKFVLELRKSFNQGGQLLATSHNSEAIRQFPKDNICLLLRKSHLEPSILRPVTEIEIHGDLVGALIRDDVDL